MEENKMGWKVIRTTSVTDGGEQGRLEGHQDNISDWWRRTRWVEGSSGQHQWLMEENKVGWKVIRTTSVTDGGEQGRLEGHQHNISDCLMEENKVGWKVIRTTSVTDGGEQGRLEGHQDNISDCQMSIMQMEMNKIGLKVRQMGILEESNRCRICRDVLTLQKDTWNQPGC